MSRLFGGGQSSQILDIHFPSDGFEPETPSLSSVQLNTLKIAKLVEPGFPKIPASNLLYIDSVSAKLESM